MCRKSQKAITDRPEERSFQKKSLQSNQAADNWLPSGITYRRQPSIHVHAWAQEVTGTERSHCTSLMCQSLQGIKIVHSWSPQQARAGTPQQVDGHSLSITPLHEVLS